MSVQQFLLEERMNLLKSAEPLGSGPNPDGPVCRGLVRAIAKWSEILKRVLVLGFGFCV